MIGLLVILATLYAPLYNDMLNRPEAVYALGVETRSVDMGTPYTWRCVSFDDKEYTTLMISSSAAAQ